MSEEDIALLRALAKLNPRPRQAVMLIAQGYPNEIVAERMGITRETVKNHLTIAYRNLFPEGMDSRYTKNVRVAYLVGRYLSEVG